MVSPPLFLITGFGVSFFPVYTNDALENLTLLTALITVFGLAFWHFSHLTVMLPFFPISAGITVVFHE